MAPFGGSICSNRLFLIGRCEKVAVPTRQAAAAFKHIGRIINLGGIDLGFSVLNTFCFAYLATAKSPPGKPSLRGLLFCWQAKGFRFLLSAKPGGSNPVEISTTQPKSKGH